MSYLVVQNREAQTLQPIIDEAPIAFQYCSDALASYDLLNYHTGLHLVAEGKSETYSVEAGNAELRHYLARLIRKTRCFSRSLEALKRLLALFIQCWNRRQLQVRLSPLYKRAVREFACIWV
jgi:IS1 family transposase